MLRPSLGRRSVKGRGAAPFALVRSVGSAAAPNMAIQGDNGVVLPWLARDFTGRFRCIYVDPPFNTGRTFREYKDARTREEWVAMIAPRLASMRALLADDGAIFVQIDDTELGPLLGVMDATFGPENRVSTITVVRSAATGHKAQNSGPVNVTDFLLVYAKDRSAFRPNPEWRVRKTYDRAYSTFLLNPEAPPSKWQFLPLRKHARSVLKDPGREQIEQFAVAHAPQVVRFAEPRFEAVGRDAQSWIIKSRSRPAEVMVFPREGRPPLVLRGGQRVLFLSSKIRDLFGERVLVEPLTNVWDDLGYQGIAKEGGVRFIRNKKPERLLERVLAIATSPGDWVLDPFLGSGTTAAVAHKMGRCWVGIEMTDSFDAMAVPRLERVVRGEDRTGISARHEFEGGGGFGVYV